MLPSVALTQLATCQLHQRGLVIEMVPHQLLQPGDKERELDLFATHRAKPPIRDGRVLKIDDLMTQCMLSSNQRTRGSIGHEVLFREPVSYGGANRAGHA